MVNRVRTEPNPEPDTCYLALSPLYAGHTLMELHRLVVLHPCAILHPRTDLHPCADSYSCTACGSHLCAVSGSHGTPSVEFSHCPQVTPSHTPVVGQTPLSMRLKSLLSTSLPPSQPFAPNCPSSVSSPLPLRPRQDHLHGLQCGPHPSPRSCASHLSCLQPHPIIFSWQESCHPLC